MLMIKKIKTPILVKTLGTIWICSIDIGYRNFAFCIEEYDKKALSLIETVPPGKRRMPNGTPTPIYSKLIEEVKKCGKVILCANRDVMKKAMKQLDPEVFHLLNVVLDEYKEYWDQCDVISIEKQMAFRGVYNVKALKIGQHTWSYFVFNYGRFKVLVDFPAYHKTDVLAAPKVEKKKRTKAGKITYKSMDKKQRKKWAVVYAKSILSYRNDVKTITKIESLKKGDDVSDCILMNAAFAILALIDKSI